jgi:hypothetical protein
MTRKLENRRKTKRRKEEQMVKFRAETITSPQNNFLAHKLTPLFSFLSLSLFSVCVIIYRAQWDSERRNREMPRTTPPPGRTSNKLPADFGCVFFLFFFLPLLNLSQTKEHLPREKKKLLLLLLLLFTDASSSSSSSSSSSLFYRAHS